MSDRAPLEQLYQIQQLDLTLDRLKAEEADVSPDLRDARTEQERLNNELETTEIALEGVEKQVRRIESDLQGVREEVARSKAEQSRNATDARMQTQFSQKIELLEERAGDFETDLEPLHAERDRLNERSKELRAAHKTLRPTLSALEDADDARVAALRASSGSTRDERAGLASGLDAKLLRDYENIRVSRKGLGIVPFAASGRCEGCQVILPTNVQQRAGQNKLPPVKCPSCGRLLIKL
jgi:uncharacterized protein